MPTYDLKVTVTFDYEVEADSFEEAHDMGYDFESLAFNAEIDSIEVVEIEGGQ
jgi:hypothetical protein